MRAAVMVEFPDIPIQISSVNSEIQKEITRLLNNGSSGDILDPSFYFAILPAKRYRLVQSFEQL